MAGRGALQPKGALDPYADQPDPRNPNFDARAAWLGAGSPVKPTKRKDPNAMFQSPLSRILPRAGK